MKHTWRTQKKLTIGNNDHHCISLASISWPIGVPFPGWNPSWSWWWDSNGDACLDREWGARRLCVLQVWLIYSKHFERKHGILKWSCWLSSPLQYGSVGMAIDLPCFFIKVNASKLEETIWHSKCARVVRQINVGEVRRRKDNHWAVNHMRVLSLSWSFGHRRFPSTNARKSLNDSCDSLGSMWIQLESDEMQPSDVELIWTWWMLTLTRISLYIRSCRTVSSLVNLFWT